MEGVLMTDTADPNNKTASALFLKYLFILLLIALALPVQAAGWIKSYSPGTGISIGRPNSPSLMELTADGGYVMAGVYSNYNPEQETYEQSIWILKLNDAGVIQWQQRFQPPDAINYTTTLKAIRQTQTQEYILAGSTRVNNRGSEAWVMKLNSNGQIDWNRTYGAELSEGANDIIETTDGGYLVIGWSDTFSEALHQYGPGGPQMYHNTDAWVFKLDAQGNIQWQKTYGGDENGCCTDGDNIARKIVSAAADGYVLLFDNYILKINLNGDVMWQKRTMLSMNDYARFGIADIQQTMDNGFIAVGRINQHIPRPNSPAYDDVEHIGIVKLDANGAVQWERAYSYSTNPFKFHKAFSVRQTTDGGYVLAGFADNNYIDKSQGLIFKFNTNGQLEWQKTYGGSGYDRLYTIRITESGGLIAAGETSLLDSNEIKLWLLKLGGSGTLFPACNLIRTTMAAERDFTMTQGFVDLTQPSQSYYIEDIPATAINTTFITQNIKFNSSTTCSFRSQMFCCKEFQIEFQQWQLLCLHNQDRFDCKRIKCNNCLLSGKMADYTFQGSLDSLQRHVLEIQPDLLSSKLNKAQSKLLYNRLKAIPVGRYFDKTLKSTVLDAVMHQPTNKELSLKHMQLLYRALAAIELDVRAPVIKPQAVRTGKDVAVDMQGISKLVFKQVHKGGQLTLRLINGLPSQMDDYEPGWPAVTYAYDFTGHLQDASEIDIELYVGVTHGNSRTQDLRMMQWDDKTGLTDITSGYDPGEMKINGTTNNLSPVFVVAKKDKQQIQNRLATLHSTSDIRPSTLVVLLVIFAFIAALYLFRLYRARRTGNR